MSARPVCVVVLALLGLGASCTDVDDAPDVDISGTWMWSEARAGGRMTIEQTDGSVAGSFQDFTHQQTGAVEGTVKKSLVSLDFSYPQGTVFVEGAVELEDGRYRITGTATSSFDDEDNAWSATLQ